MATPSGTDFYNVNEPYWELRTAGVCPEESEVVLALQLRGHQEPVAPLHLRHFDLGLAQDGRLLVLAEDEKNSTQ